MTQSNSVSDFNLTFQETGLLWFILQSQTWEYRGVKEHRRTSQENLVHFLVSRQNCIQANSSTEDTCLILFFFFFLRNLILFPQILTFWRLSLISNKIPMSFYSNAFIVLFSFSSFGCWLKLRTADYCDIFTVLSQRLK